MNTNLRIDKLNLLDQNYIAIGKYSEKEIKDAISFLAQELYWIQENKGKGKFVFGTLKNNPQESIPLFRNDDIVENCNLLLKMTEY